MRGVDDILREIEVAIEKLEKEIDNLNPDEIKKNGGVVKEFQVGKLKMILIKDERAAK